MENALTDIFGDPTPEYEVWTATQWTLSITAALIGLTLVAFWPYALAALTAANDRVRLPGWMYILVGLVSILTILAFVVYAIVFMPFMMPRAMDTSVWVRFIPGVLSVLAGLRAAVYAYHEGARFPVLAVLVGAPAALAVMGVANDYFSRVASGIPIAVTALYTFGIVIVVVAALAKSYSR